MRAIFAVPTIMITAGCAAPAPDAETTEFAQTVREATIPASLAAGEAAFVANCMTCHGERGLAAQRGVRAHHWDFGDMPPIPEVDTEELRAIVPYIRFLQEQVGIR